MRRGYRSVREMIGILLLIIAAGVIDAGKSIKMDLVQSSVHLHLLHHQCGQSNFDELIKVLLTVNLLDQKRTFQLQLTIKAINYKTTISAFLSADASVRWPHVG